MAFENSVHAKAVDLTKLTIEMTTAAGSGHPSSGASLAHLVTVLMYDQMRWSPADPGSKAADRLVLSEGHAVPIIYAACADLGVHVEFDGQMRPLTRDDVMHLRESDSPVDGHPNPVEGFPFFDAATGSLGQGLSVAAGIALAARLDGMDKRVYAIIGDGESREGQIWEAVDFIADHKLAGVCPIFNCNAYAQSDAVAAQQEADATARKLEAVGYKVALIDGHNPTEIKAALEAHQANQAGEGKPFAIVARTVKGWGAASQQGNGHHGSPVKQDDIESVFAEIDETAKQIGAAWTDGDLSIKPITNALPDRVQTQGVPNFDDALSAAGKADALAKGKWATRRAYGVSIKTLGHANPNVVALDADVQGSTGAADFAKDDALAARFVECRIAEQNMISVAAGLGAGGKIPFASTFAKFLTRGYDQVEMAINSGLNFKLVGSHAGVSLGADGPSQMGMPDVAWFRAFTKVMRKDGKPAMYVLTPGDAYATYGLINAMADHDGPCYMRTLRPDTDVLYDAKTPFTLGGHELVVEGSDLLICASGYMLGQAVKAVDKLEEDGVKPMLVDLYSLPFDEAAIAELANQCEGRVLTLEDNYTGGIGSAVAEALAVKGVAKSFKSLHVTRTPKSGKDDKAIMEQVNLTVDDVIAAANDLLEPAEA